MNRDNDRRPPTTTDAGIMPFEEARSYRFNPFDLTKVWPHEDYPLHEVGRLRLDRNPTDFHTEIEQAAFEPNNLVPGISVSPDKMLLARVFSYADAHRGRIGVNYNQIPVNRPKVAGHSYSKDGAMRVQNVSDPVYASNSKGGPAADPQRYPYVEKWEADGEFVHAAYTIRREDVPAANRVDRAVELFGLRREQVAAALAYYAEFTQEIDVEVAANRAAAEETETLCRRQQDLLTG
jgi:catalase